MTTSRLGHGDARGSAIDDLPPLWDGFARMLRAGLGLSAFGANVMNIPADYTTKSHDEQESGQEELYVGLSGSGWIVLDEDGERLPVSPEHVVAVGPGRPRAVIGGSDGLRLLIIGGSAGAVYEPQDWSTN